MTYTIYFKNRLDVPAQHKKSTIEYTGDYLIVHQKEKDTVYTLSRVVKVLPTEDIIEDTKS